MDESERKKLSAFLFVDGVLQTVRENLGKKFEIFVASFIVAGVQEGQVEQKKLHGHLFTLVTQTFQKL